MTEMVKRRFLVTRCLVGVLAVVLALSGCADSGNDTSSSGGTSSGSSSGARFTNGQAASTVLGQANFGTAKASAGKTGQNQTSGVVFDTEGRMWVSDTFNNRVLGYTPPFRTGMEASIVIGQQDFTTTTASTTATGLRSPFGLAFDGDGNLWVADTENHRVLKYTKNLHTGMKASLVLGQPGYTTKTAQVTRVGMKQPGSVSLDSEGNLWVPDYGNNRVLEYKAPFHSGQAAEVVIGQPTFTSSAAATTRTGLRGAIGVAFDRDGKLWVADAENNRMLQYDKPFTNGEAASIVLGQANYTSCAVNGQAGGSCQSVNLSVCPGGSLPSFLSGGGAPSGSAPSGGTGMSSGPPSGGKSPAVTRTGLVTPTSPTFDTQGNMWIADGLNNRVLMYEAPFTAGESPSIVLGQSDFTSNEARCTADGLTVPAGMAFDSGGNLWVADSFNNRTVGYQASSR